MKQFKEVLLTMLILSQIMTTVYLGMYHPKVLQLIFASVGIMVFGIFIYKGLEKPNQETLKT